MKDSFELLNEARINNERYREKALNPFIKAGIKVADRAGVPTSKLTVDIVRAPNSTGRKVGKIIGISMFSWLIGTVVSISERDFSYYDVIIKAPNGVKAYKTLYAPDQVISKVKGPLTAAVKKGKLLQ